MKLQQQYIAVSVILVKEVRRFLRIWMQTVLPAAITMTLYFVIFGNLIGSQLGDIHGVSYIDYIVPGLILMSMINNSYGNVVSSFFSSKFQRHVEELLISPMPNYLIIIGYVSGGMVRGLVVGTVVAMVATFFVDIQVHNLAIVLSVALLTTMLFSLGGFINAVFARNFDDVAIIPTFVLTPLTYLGGVFYSVNMLPEVWQQISLVNPILYMINAMRFGMLGVSDINIVTAMTIICLFVVGLFLFALYLLNRGIGVRS